MKRAGTCLGCLRLGFQQSSWRCTQRFTGTWIVDDAGLTFAYARSLSSGDGLVLQPGAAPVEGFSSPAWMALLVVGRWLGLFDHGAWVGTLGHRGLP